MGRANFAWELGKKAHREELIQRRDELQTSQEMSLDSSSSTSGQATKWSYRNNLALGLAPNFEMIRASFVFPGFYLTRQAMHFQPSVEDIVLQAIGVTKLSEIRPRVLAWLLATFKVMYEGHDAYILNDQPNDAFYSAVVMEVARRGVVGAGIATHPTTTQVQEGFHPAADVEITVETLKMINPGVLRYVVEEYVRTRREFLDRSVQKKRLVTKSKMKDNMAKMKNVMKDEEDEDEDENGETFVVEDDNGTDDEDDLFIRVLLEYRPEDHSYKENLLLSYVDRWISCLDQKAGTDIDDDLMKDLEMF
ncbi:hypothetical protein AB5N19_11496 [Seiridium cardinale]|uniref:Uncharacterized protein n=1 Tax=Seiridium cardinale TaxID=138064 RepID=A0ABR2XUT3_9PEZI